jgi:RimJ/RimL family protein N-acetyltransferase
LGHAFEHLGAEKVTLKCDVNNLHSASAIRKLGAKPEGVLRRHRLTQHGFFRDTAFFSILKEEWPEVKVNLENRLTYLS